MHLGLTTLIGTLSCGAFRQKPDLEVELTQGRSDFQKHSQELERNVYVVDSDSRPLSQDRKFHCGKMGAGIVFLEKGVEMNVHPTRIYETMRLELPFGADLTRFDLYDLYDKRATKIPPIVVSVGVTSDEEGKNLSVYRKTMKLHRFGLKSKIIRENDPVFTLAANYLPTGAFLSNRAKQQLAAQHRLVA